MSKVNQLNYKELSAILISSHMSSPHVSFSNGLVTCKHHNVISPLLCGFIMSVTINNLDSYEMQSVLKSLNTNIKLLKFASIV